MTISRAKENLGFSRSKYAPEKPVLHFQGGLRGAAFGNENCFELWPLGLDEDQSTPRTIVVDRVPEDKLIKFFNDVGLRWVGIAGSFLPVKDTGNNSRVIQQWNVFNYGVSINYGELNAADKWSAISTGCKKQKADKAGELACSIAFRLQGLETQIHNLSKHYNTQLMTAMKEDIKVGTRFQNEKTSEVILAAQSCFVELGTIRDHLAEFFATFCLDLKGVDNMSRLVKRITQESKPSPLSSHILELAGDTEGAWLRVLSKIRNKVVHKSPLHYSTAYSPFSILQLNSETLMFPLYYQFDIEDDCILLMRRENKVDVLELIHTLFIGISDLALKVAEQSPYKAMMLKISMDNCDEKGLAITSVVDKPPTIDN